MKIRRKINKVEFKELHPGEVFEIDHYPHPIIKLKTTENGQYYTGACLHTGAVFNIEQKDFVMSLRAECIIGGEE